MLKSELSTASVTKLKTQLALQHRLVVPTPEAIRLKRLLSDWSIATADIVTTIERITDSMEKHHHWRKSKGKRKRNDDDQDLELSTIAAGDYSYIEDECWA